MTRSTPLWHKAMLVIACIALALSALIATTQTTTGTTGSGHLEGNWINSTHMDGDGDHQFDVSVCMGTSSTDFLYTNRANFYEYLKSTFNNILVGDDGIVNGEDHADGFYSAGWCNAGNPAILEVRWGNIFGGNCNAGAELARTTLPNYVTMGDQAYGKYWLVLNQQCPWDYTGTIDAGKYCLKCTIGHEAGHAFGIGHSFDSNEYGDGDGAMMRGPFAFGPSHCSWIGNASYASSWDQWHLNNIGYQINIWITSLPADPFCFG